MIETSEGSIPYHVVYSEFVRNELKKLVARAKKRGCAAPVGAALAQIDRILHVFPQFGDLLADLSLAPGELRILTIPPLVVKYAIYDDKRLVIVTTPIAPLPRSGF